MRQNGYERSYIKHGMKRFPGWIQKLRTYPKCALKACLWCVGGFSGWKTMGRLSHRQVMGHLKVMEGIKQWLPALGTKESWVCAHICVCLCVVGKGKEVYVCLWEWKRASEVVRAGHIHARSPILSFFLLIRECQEPSQPGGTFLGWADHLVLA